MDNEGDAVAEKAAIKEPVEIESKKLSLRKRKLKRKWITKAMLFQKKLQ